MINDQHPLDVPVKMNGELVIPRELDLDLQIDYLIQNHFKFFCSRENKLWRLSHLYHIMDKNGRKVLFKLNKAQKHFAETYLLVPNPYRRIIILKSRQLGFTTLIALWFLDEVIWKPNTEALQIAHTVADAKEIFNRKVRYAINNLPAPAAKILKTDQKRAARVQFMYPDNSISAVTVAGSGRSGTYHLLHVSEFAKLAKTFESRAEEVIKGTLPSVPMDGTVFIESTAEGMSGLYYEMFMNAWKRRHLITPAMSKAEFYPVFYNWTWDEEEIAKAAADGTIPVENMEIGEIDWRAYKEENDLTDEQLTYYYTKWIQMNRDVHRLHQEICTSPIEAFIGSGSNFYSLKKIADSIQKLEDSETEHKLYSRFSFLNNEFVPDPEGDLYIKTQPSPGKKYVIGADVAQGLAHGDYSTACVLGLDKEIKAFYRGHIEPDDFEKLLRVLGTKYNTALLTVESNFDGNWVNSNLVAHNYPNIYLKTSFDDITKTVSKSFGWRTDATSRKNIMENSRVYVLRNFLDFRPLLDEMLTFIRDKRSKPQAASGKHDDCIMAWAIALYAVGDKKDVEKKIDTPNWATYVYG